MLDILARIKISGGQDTKLGFSRSMRVALGKGDLDGTRGDIKFEVTPCMGCECIDLGPRLAS